MPWSLRLFHVQLDETDFVIIQTILGIQLPVYAGHRPQPIDVEGRKEILKRNIPPARPSVFLRPLQNMPQCAEELGFNMLHQVLCLMSHLQCTNTDK